MKITIPTAYRGRRMALRDIDQVVAIERLFYTDPWAHSDFNESIEDTNRICVVSEAIGRRPPVVAYCVFERVFDYLQVLTMAVGPAHQGQGIGRVMLNGIKQAARRQELKKVVFPIAEENLNGQLFLKACGFFAFDPIEVRGQTFYTFEYYL